MVLNPRRSGGSSDCEVTNLKQAKRREDLTSNPETKQSSAEHNGLVDELNTTARVQSISLLFGAFDGEDMFVVLTGCPGVFGLGQS